jgi:hypothetical protein
MFLSELWEDLSLTSITKTSGSMRYGNAASAVIQRTSLISILGGN